MRTVRGLDRASKLSFLKTLSAFSSRLSDRLHAHLQDRRVSVKYVHLVGVCQVDAVLRLGRKVVQVGWAQIPSNDNC